jgi:hypothetical protein
MSDLKEKLVDDIRGKLMGLLQRAPYIRCEDVHRQYAVNWLMNNGVTIQECARPLEKWNEDYGDALWWKFPIEEPPYVGSPLDMSWPGYHTHWTLIPMPQPSKGE